MLYTAMKPGSLCVLIQVNKSLMELIEASALEMKPHEWTNLPNKSSGKYFIKKPITNLISYVMRLLSMLTVFMYHPIR